VKVRTDEGGENPVTRRARLLAARCARCGVSWHRNTTIAVRCGPVLRGVIWESRRRRVAYL